MAIHSHTFRLDTGRRPAVIDITSRLVDFVAGSGDGLLSVLVPHSTAGLAIIEVGAASDRDLLRYLQEGVIHGPVRWEHRHGAPGHGADHIIPAFISPTLVLPVENGSLPLGTWQSVAVVDTNVDNPSRQVRLSFLPG